jgi:hypothetical protein
MRACRGARQGDVGVGELFVQLIDLVMQHARNCLGAHADPKAGSGDSPQLGALDFDVVVKHLRVGLIPVGLRPYPVRGMSR